MCSRRTRRVGHFARGRPGTSRPACRARCRKRGRGQVRFGDARLLTERHVGDRREVIEIAEPFARLLEPRRTPPAAPDSASRARPGGPPGRRACGFRRPGSGPCPPRARASRATSSSRVSPSYPLRLRCAGYQTFALRLRLRLSPPRPPIFLVGRDQDDERALDRMVEGPIRGDAQVVPALVGAAHPLVDGRQVVDDPGGQLLDAVRRG